MEILIKIIRIAFSVAVTTADPYRQEMPRTSRHPHPLSLALPSIRFHFA